MSKLSFRARALDVSKPMPVLRAEDVPDLPDFAAINRAVPQMPTGMEKEEECEHHLQRAISAQQAFGRAVDHVIPTPEVSQISDKDYQELYPANCKSPRNYIHIQLQSFEQDYPEYDMDSEDEEWFNKEKQKLNINETKFEQMIECLEKSAGIKVIDLNEAKSLLKGDESVVISVYDYWLNKKLRLGKSLLPTIKTEKRDGSSGNNPYIAFRRRTEKMQTRKNRKNDETSYEKMLKLKRDFTDVREMMEYIKRRESLKLEQLKYSFEIVEKRYLMGDYNGQIYGEIMAARQAQVLAAQNNQAREKASRISKNEESAQARRKRDYKKRPKQEATVPQRAHRETGEFSSDDENANDIIFQGGQIASDESDDNPDGQFAFKRKKGCNYQAPLVDRFYSWPWDSPDEGGTGNPIFRFNYTTLSRPPIPIGFARRRIGRGGRIIFDRAFTEFNDEDCSENTENQWLHFRPASSYVDDEAYRVDRFNAETFSDDDISEEPLNRLADDTTLENRLYEYHKSKLSSRTSSALCNSQHSTSDSNANSSPSTSSNPPSSSASSSSSSAAAAVAIVSSKPASASKECESIYSIDINASRSFLDTLQTDLSDNPTVNNEGKHDFEMALYKSDTLSSIARPAAPLLNLCDI